MIKAVKRGVTPLYMADPSESTSVEVPNWLLERRKKDAERKRMERANAPKKEKKNDPVPGRLRVKQCRENQRKTRIAPVESTDSAAVVYVSNAIFELHPFLL